jgi:hypothetical protein
MMGWIGTADRTPRETLKERLAKTPSCARCFAQGSSLVCWSTLESLMGTAHGAEELGLCSHGLACRLPSRHHGPLHRVLPRIWPYLGKYYELNMEKYSARPITVSHQGGEGRGYYFFTPYKFRIFSAGDEIRRFKVPIRRYRIVMIISYLLIFTSTELDFFKNNSKMTNKIEYCRSCTYRICHLSFGTI